MPATVMTNPNKNRSLIKGGGGRAECITGLSTINNEHISTEE